MKLNFPNEIDKVTIKYGCDFIKYLKSAKSRLFKESELFDQQFFTRLGARDVFANNRQDLYRLS